MSRVVSGRSGFTDLSVLLPNKEIEKVFVKYLSIVGRDVEGCLLDVRAV